MGNTKPTKACPFCKSKNLDISNKTATSNYKNRMRHISVYCKKCHCYGPRIISKDDGVTKNDEIAIKQAVAAWNAS